MSILQINSTPTHLINAVACILEDYAASITEFRYVGRNRCPWARYRSKNGSNCATFISPKKFSGYHFKFETKQAICTNLETGNQYIITFNPLLCTCPVITKAHKSECKHMKLLLEQPGWADLAKIHEQGATSALIDSSDVPHGCFLKPTGDGVSAEYTVHVYVIEQRNGQARVTTKGIGRICEISSSGISAYRPRSGIDHSFDNTFDAVKRLFDYQQRVQH